MSSNKRRIGLRCREKLKLKSQKNCKKCKRNFFPSSYSEYDFDFEDNDEICVDCNAKRKTLEQSQPPLPSIAQQLSKISIPAISRQSHILPAFKYIIPTTVSQKTPKTSNDSEISSSTIENANEPALGEVQRTNECKGTIKFDRTTKIRATSGSIELRSVSQKPTNPYKENEDAMTNRATISFESMSSLDPLDDFMAPLPINNDNNNQSIRTRKRKKPQTIIPTNINNKTSLESVKNSVSQLKKSAKNVQLDEQICLTSTGKTNTKFKSAPIKPPVATRVSTRIRKILVPFGSNCSQPSTSVCNEHQEPITSAEIAKIQCTNTQTQPNEGNANLELQPAPNEIDPIQTESSNQRDCKIDILNMIVIHSRVHSSKEMEITTSETLPVRPMDIKQEPVVKETNSIDLDIQQNDSIDTLREKFPNVSRYELEYLLFLSKA